MQLSHPEVPQSHSAFSLLVLLSHCPFEPPHKSWYWGAAISLFVWCWLSPGSYQQPAGRRGQITVWICSSAGNKQSWTAKIPREQLWDVLWNVRWGENLFFFFFFSLNKKAQVKLSTDCSVLEEDEASQAAHRPNVSSKAHCHTTGCLAVPWKPLSSAAGAGRCWEPWGELGLLGLPGKLLGRWVNWQQSCRVAVRKYSKICIFPENIWI